MLNLSSAQGPALRFVCAAVALVLWAPPGALAQTADERAGERALRRAQQQSQVLQQQLDATSAKAQQEREALARQLASREQAASRAAAAQRALAASLQAAESARDALQLRVQSLEAELTELRTASAAALAGKERELAALSEQQRGTAGERDSWQQRFAQQARRATESQDKNERLLALNAELLERWHRKGLIEVVRQREPMLGLRDVELFNLVQDHRDRAEAARAVAGAPQP